MVRWLSKILESVLAPESTPRDPVSAPATSPMAPATPPRRVSMPMYASPTRTGPYQDSIVQEELPDLMVMSPSQRLRTKGFCPLVPKRSHKYCQKEDCVFNCMAPGRPARKDTGQQFCTWCDDDLLTAALQLPERNANKSSSGCIQAACGMRHGCIV